MQTDASRDETPRIGLREAKAMVDRGENTLFVDVRTRPDFERSHIPGSISIPLRELPQRYDELPKDRWLILY